ncbi:Acetyl-coenzyme A carboxylase carboxyl transferase subunit alpha [Nymphaea thermarum]|nr:Acetyl-coenzyme A carboxylase carboxyl transferase subunit alpha [Nymphaea thermarum]
MSSLPHFPATSSGRPASDLLRSSFTDGMPLKTLGRASFWIRPRRLELSVLCMKKMRKVKKHDYPWPDPKDVDPDVKRGFTTYLSDFKPLAEKPKPVPLPFEKPLMDLEMKITDVKKMAEETGLDFTDQISLLENKYQQALKDLYTRLTPIQRLSIARHPNRPTFLDHVLNITDKWVELHGDRAGYDDPAIVTGLGCVDGKNYMFIGHQKGRNTKENIHRNFAMPTPHGPSDVQLPSCGQDVAYVSRGSCHYSLIIYRKALRMMYYADHHGFPIVTFIDTPGAFADLKSEEIGQGEAIAHNLRTMFGLKVPIVTVVIGEGGSGGALAIGCANKLLMMENSVFYVARATEVGEKRFSWIVRRGSCRRSTPLKFRHPSFVYSPSVLPLPRDSRRSCFPCRCLGFRAVTVASGSMRAIASGSAPLPRDPCMPMLRVLCRHCWLGIRARYCIGIRAAASGSVPLGIRACHCLGIRVVIVALGSVHPIALGSVPPSPRDSCVPLPRDPCHHRLGIRVHRRLGFVWSPLCCCRRHHRCPLCR